MGVLVNGVPLYATVGLAHPHLMPKVAASDAGSTSPPHECAGATTICGRYERIDPQQIVFSFKMPQNSEIGIPTITLVAPGKSVDINSLPDLFVNGRRLVKKSDNTDEKLVEDDAAVRFMFGVSPSSVLSITDLILLKDSSSSAFVQALLTGTGFDGTKDVVYINGVQLEKAPGTKRTFKSANVYELEFSLPSDVNLKVAVVQDKLVVTKTFPNPGALEHHQGNGAQVRSPRRKTSQ